MTHTQLSGLAPEANAISEEIDNSLERYLFDDVELHYESGYAGSFSDGSGVDLYMVRQDLDGTGYEDGDGSIDPPAMNLVGVFDNNTSESQVHILRQIPVPPAKYKYVVINRTGTWSTNTDSDVLVLKHRPYRYKT